MTSKFFNQEFDSECEKKDWLKKKIPETNKMYI